MLKELEQQLVQSTNTRLEQELDGIKRAQNDLRFDVNVMCQTESAKHNTTIQEFQLVCQDQLTKHEISLQKLQSVTQDRCAKHEASLQRFQLGCQNQFTKHETSIQQLKLASRDHATKHETSIQQVESACQDQFTKHETTIQQLQSDRDAQSVMFKAFFQDMQTVQVTSNEAHVRTQLEWQSDEDGRRKAWQDNLMSGIAAVATAHRELQLEVRTIRESHPARSEQSILSADEEIWVALHAVWQKGEEERRKAWQDCLESKLTAVFAPMKLTQ